MNKLAFFSILLLSFVAPSCAMEKNQELYLVVGSIRKNSEKAGFPVENIWKEGKADLLHVNTYDAQATTMDTEESALIGAKHIVANACQYAFKDNVIRAAYLERLPTIGVEENHLGACIQNISKAMIQGAVMEIEWHPYTTVISKKIADINCIYDEQRVKKNPFTAAIDINVVVAAIHMICAEKVLNANPPKQFIACAETLSKTVQGLLDFYQKENVGEKHLLAKRLKEELWILQRLMLPNQKAFLSVEPGASLERFSEAAKSFPFLETEDNSLVGKPFAMRVDNKVIKGIFYDARYFLANSFLSFLLSDASVEFNSSYVKQSMHDYGFKDITIERTISPHNGRKNVWIIRAVKS